jgi:DNA-binding winged helix-turn-helix (wHTH) protein
MEYSSQPHMGCSGFKRKIAIAPGARRLIVNDVVVALEPRVFDLLVQLARRRPRIVRTDELCDFVWQRDAARPQRLANYIKKARRALGDETLDSGAIRTVYGLGYQFVGQVEWRDE